MCAIIKIDILYILKMLGMYQIYQEIYRAPGWREIYFKEGFMKKALSILLSVMIVAGLFVALVPTASAAELYVVDEVELGETLYFNDFEDVDGSLEGDDLLAELGWYLSSNVDANGDGYGDTKYNYDSHLRDAEGNALADVLVSENCADGSQAITIMSTAGVAGGNGGTWETLTFLGDERLAGGDYVIEFDFMALSTHIEADNAPDFLGTGASGASAGPISVAKYNASAKAGVYWHYGIKSRGQTDIHCSYPGGTNGGKAYGGADYATAALGGESMYSITTAVNKTIRFRIVIDSTYGLSAWASYDEGSTWTQTDGMTEANATAFASVAKYIGKEIKWRNTSNFDVAIDNLGIYTIAGKEKTGTSNIPTLGTTPELVITEVSTQATATDNQKFETLVAGDETNGALAGKDGLYYQVDENGNYLLPETPDHANNYNGQTRFEYLEIYNSGNTTVDLSDYSISSWNLSGSYSNAVINGVTTLSAYSRIHKGLKVITDSADGITWQYYNAPEDCILAPGESAVLFMPNNWFYSTATVGHVNAFKQYVLIDEYGYSPEEVEAMKILTLYDSLDELWEIGGLYDKDGDGTPETKNYSLVNGMGINNSGNSFFAVVKDNADGSVPYTWEEGKCYYTDVEDSVVSALFDSQNANSLTGALWGDMYGGESREGYKTGKGYSAQYTYWDAEGNYIPLGKLVYSGTGSRTPGSVPAELQKPATTQANALFTGIQTAADGSVRFVAEIADIANVKSIAFNIEVPDAGTPALSVYVRYVYEKMSTNFGEDDLGFKYAESNYFVALVVSGVGDYGEMGFLVSITTEFKDGTTVTTDLESVTAAF